MNPHDVIGSRQSFFSKEFSSTIPSMPKIPTTQTCRSSNRRDSRDLVFWKQVNVPVASLTTNHGLERGHGIQKCIIQPIETGRLRSSSMQYKTTLKSGKQVFALPMGNLRTSETMKNSPRHQMWEQGRETSKSAISEMYRVSLILIQKEIMQTRSLSPLSRSKTSEIIKTNFPDMKDFASTIKDTNAAAPFNDFNKRFKHGRYSYSKFLEAIGAFRNIYSDMRPRLNLHGIETNVSQASSAMLRTKPHAIFCSAHCEISGALSCNKCIQKLHQFMSERNIDHLFSNPRFKLLGKPPNASEKKKNTENETDSKVRLQVNIPVANAISSDIDDDNTELVKPAVNSKLLDI